MENHALNYELMERRPRTGKGENHYRSVEFDFDGLDYIYQYKIWNTDSDVMCVLVKENSGILPWLKKGDTLNLKYNPMDRSHPFANIDTHILYITKQIQGRYRGHYQVGFEITGGYRESKTQWPYLLKTSKVLPFQNSITGH